MSAIELLERAADLMLERGDHHAGDGGGEHAMERVLAAFNAITGRDLTDQEGWLFMCLMKMVRQSQSPEWDQTNSEYLIAYAAFMAESWERSNEIEISFDPDFDADDA